LNVFELFATIKLDSSQYNRELSKTEQRLDKFGQRAQRIGGTLTRNLTLPLTALGGGIIAVFANFEASMNRVAGITGATGDQFERLSNLARDLGETTQFSASEAADGMGFLAQAGFEVEEIMAALPGVLELAAAGQLSLAEAADLASNVLTGFGLQAEEVGRVNDVLAKAATSTNTNVRQLGEAFSFVAPVAAGLGVSVEEAGAAIGVLSNAGIQGTRAGTGLRRVLTTLVNESDKLGISVTQADGTLRPFADIMEDLEDTGLDTSQMLEIFGDRGGPAIATLLSEGSDAIRALEGDLNDAGGTAAALAEIQMRGLLGAFRELRSALEGVAIAIGEAGLGELVENIADSITTLVRAFGELDNDTINFLVTAGAVVAALGPAIAAFGFLASGVGSAITAFRTMASVLPAIISGLFGPVGIIVLALTLFAEAYRRDLGGFRDAVNQMFEVADVILGNIAMAFNVLRKNISRIISAVGDTMQVFGDLLSGVYDQIRGVFTFDRGLIRQGRTTARVAFGFIRDAAQATFEDMEGFTFSWENRLSDAFTFVGEEAEDSAEDTEEAFEGAAENVATSIETMADVLNDNVTQMVNRTLTEVQRFGAGGRPVTGGGPGERPGDMGGPDPFATDRAEESMQRRREIETEMDAIAESAARREANLTRRYQEEVDIRQYSAEEEARRREELLIRQTEAARRAMNEAMSMAGSFASAFTAFSNNLTQAIGNMVQRIGNSMEDMAALIASGVTAFLSGIGEMIGSAAVGEEGIGASFGKMVLQLIAQLSTMILGIMITAKVMGAQWWNPALAIAGGIGLVAASAGLAALAGLRNQQGSSAGAPGSVNAMQSELRDLREQRDAATSQAERDRLNEEIERLEGEIAEARGQDEPAPSQMQDSDEPTHGCILWWYQPRCATCCRCTTHGCCDHHAVCRAKHSSGLPDGWWHVVW